MTDEYFANTTKPKLDENSQALKQVSELVTRIETARQTIAEQEAELKKQKQYLMKLEEVDLVALMDEIGLADITTTNGREVSIKDTLYASVPKKNKRAAAEWLMTHGHGSLVSEAVIATFEKGAGDKVQQAVEALVNQGIKNVSVDETMNTGSIKALIRELTGQGQDVPMDIFGAYWKRAAVVK
jgi:uncharacterized small protein (DUF1192 family)